MNDLPNLPPLPEDPTGSGAAKVLLDYAAENPTPETAQAIVDWLRKVSGSLFLLRGAAGVQPQTATDIENLRQRVFIYDDLLGQNPDKVELQAWVLGPLVRGDFRGVPDALPENDTFKMPGVFEGSEFKQAEVAWAYQLAKAVGFENDLFWKQLQTFGKDLAKAGRDAIKPTVPTGLAVAGGLAAGFVLAKLLD